MRPDLVLPILAALLVSACDGGDPVDSAVRETAAKNHADATQTTAEAAFAHGQHPASGQTPGDAAFAASEAAMHTGMASASGETVDDAYIAKMIEHHRGAVAMANVALAQSRDPEIRRMAWAVKDTQTREIAEMRAWTPETRPAP